MNTYKSLELSLTVLQYNCLSALAKGFDARGEHLREIDQRPLAGLLRREMITGAARLGVRLTKKGLAAIERYESGEMPRRTISRRGEYRPVAPSVEGLLRQYRFHVVGRTERPGAATNAA